MRCLFLLFTLLVVLSNQALSQLYYGIKANYSIPITTPQEIKYDDQNDFLVYRVNFINQSVSPTISALGYYRKDWIYFQSEISYKQVRTRFIADNFVDLNAISTTENVKLTKSLDIPIIAGLRLEKFKLGFGPSFSFILSENKLFTDVEYFEELRSKIETGFGFYFGVVLYRLHLDFGYQVKFNGVGDYLYWRGAYRGFSQGVKSLDIGIAYIF